MSAGAVSGSALLASLERAPPVFKEDDLEYDLALLAAFDHHPLDPASLAASRERALDAAAAANTQLLVRALFALPRERVQDVGTALVLPKANSRLPRAQPPPAPRPPTAWEEFAKTKGIKKRSHRERMVYDEKAKDFAPRHGFKRARADDSAPMVYELKAGDDPKADHFERLELQKKQRVNINSLNRVNNAERATKGKDRRTGGAQVPSASGGGGGDAVRRAPAGIPSIPIAEGRADAVSGPGRQPKIRPTDSAATKAAQIRLTQSATASMGKVRQRSVPPHAHRTPTPPAFPLRTSDPIYFRARKHAHIHTHTRARSSTPSPVMSPRGRRTR